MRSEWGPVFVQCKAFLPPELLVIIFKLVHEKSDHENLIQKFRYGEADSSSPSIFPYALASVCRMWRDVMSTVPEFWTQLIVFIDSNSSSLSYLRSRLEWSRDLLFQIAATRRSDSFESNEKALVRQVVDILGPHLHRCSWLHFDVIYSSSLPAIYADICHNRSRPSLQGIIFNSRVGDGPGSYLGGDPPNGWSDECLLPALKCLTLDGFNYVDLYNHHPDGSWFTSPHVLKDVSISHFTRSRFQPSCSFYDLYLLSNVTHLKLSSLEFTCDPVDGTDDLMMFSELVTLELENLSSQLTQEVLSRCEHVSNVTITRCPVGEILDIELDAFFLTLEDIPSSGNLSQFLSNWLGSELTMRNCPGFNDSVLKGWSTMTPDSLLPGHLTIHNCPNFSIEPLKHLIDVRMENSIITGGVEEGEFPLLSIEVTGHGPFLSDEDRLWFLNNVESFRRWETYQDAS